MPRKLIFSCEVLEQRDNGRWAFLHRDIVWKEDRRIYRIEHPTDHYDLDSLIAPEPIPEPHLYPRWREGFKEAPTPLPDDCYMKFTNPVDYDSDDPDRLPNLLLHEIAIFERLAEHPHPNVCPYYGVVREGDYIVGIALRRFPADLGELAIEKKPIDGYRVLSSIKSGIDHLHYLGLVHNDLNPGNVMVDADGNAVLIDFGLTAEEGSAKNPHFGTPSWFRPSAVSRKDDDYFALGKIAEFLDTKKWPYLDCEADAPSTWTDDYLRRKALIIGDLDALQAASQLLTQMLENGYRITFFTQDSSCLMVSAWFAPFASSATVQAIEGDLAVPSDVERARSMASSGYRLGELDLVLSLVDFDLESGNGRRSLWDAYERLRVPIQDAPTLPTSPKTWIVLANIPSTTSHNMAPISRGCLPTWQVLTPNPESHALGRSPCEGKDGLEDDTTATSCAPSSTFLDRTLVVSLEESVEGIPCTEMSISGLLDMLDMLLNGKLDDLKRTFLGDTAKQCDAARHNSV